jgi:hypothetical protein
MTRRDRTDCRYAKPAASPSESASKIRHLRRAPNASSDDFSPTGQDGMIEVSELRGLRGMRRYFRHVRRAFVTCAVAIARRPASRRRDRVRSTCMTFDQYMQSQVDDHNLLRREY